MGTPNRNDILTDFRQALAEITIAGGYKSTVREVGKKYCDWAESGVTAVDPRAFLAVWRDSESKEYQPFGVIQCALTVNVLGHVYGADTDAIEAALDNLEDDIIAVLSADTRRGGYAIETTLVRTDTTEGLDVTLSSGAVGSLGMEWVVRYERTVNAS